MMESLPVVDFHKDVLGELIADFEGLIVLEGLLAQVLP
jgi:hypothetical protein